MNYGGIETSSLAYNVLHFGHSVEKNPFKFVGHVRDRRLVEAYGSPEVFKSDLFTENEKGAIPFRYLLSSLSPLQ